MWKSLQKGDLICRRVVRRVWNFVSVYRDGFLNMCKCVITLDRLTKCIFNGLVMHICHVLLLTLHSRFYSQLSKLSCPGQLFGMVLTLYTIVIVPCKSYWRLVTFGTSMPITSIVFEKDFCPVWQLTITIDRPLVINFKFSCYKKKLHFLITHLPPGEYAWRIGYLTPR